jgi:hypothetical protein
VGPIAPRQLLFPSPNLWFFSLPAAPVLFATATTTCTPTSLPRPPPPPPNNPATSASAAWSLARRASPSPALAEPGRPRTALRLGRSSPRSRSYLCGGDASTLPPILISVSVSICHRGSRRGRLLVAGTARHDCFFCACSLLSKVHKKRREAIWLLCSWLGKIISGSLRLHS